MIDPVSAVSLLKRFWPAIPILAMAGFIGFQQIELGWKDDEIAKAANRVTEEVSRRTTAEGNLASAQGTIDRLNADVRSRAKDLESATALAKADQAIADARYASTKQIVAALEASSRKGGTPCTLSREAAAALEGL